MDLSFWIGLGTAIPLSIAANFATTGMQRWWEGRPQRAVSARRRTLEKRIEAARSAFEVYGSPLEFGLHRQASIMRSIAFMVAIGAMAIVILLLRPGLSDDTARMLYFSALGYTMFASILLMFLAVAVQNYAREIQRVTADMRDLAHLEGQLAALDSGSD